CGNSYDAIASLGVNTLLEPGEEKEIIFTLGAIIEDFESAEELIKKYKSIQQVNIELDKVKSKWKEIVDVLYVQTPDESLNVMVNAWLKYQTISGRLWGRSAYYQIGGAYGFRDQLQDSLLFLYIDPEKTKQQIILHAKHQFKNGIVYHWWHPITEQGLVNEISDNRLWLPFTVIKYIEETGDLSILDEPVPFVDDPNPVTLYEHCIRAIDLSLSKFSARGLPLIGAGDWNDGLNAVGLDGKGESIWLAHFLYKILIDFSEIAEMKNDKEKRESYREKAKKLKQAINEIAWEEEWYFRATKDNGEKIGSKDNEFGKIFLNAQTWAIIAGVADSEKSHIAMNSVEKYLECEIGPLLLYPAYKKPDPYIGYLTRYAPGMRENGGVYTHAATWCIIAEALLKRNHQAYRLLSKINPANPNKDIDRYCAEPYVTSGNIEGPESPFFGRAGWTWYTGSSAWLLRAVVDYILGIRATFKGLYIDPCIPAHWKSFTLKRIFRKAVYLIQVEKLSEEGIPKVKEVYLNDDLILKNQSEETGVLLPIFEPNTINRIKIIL
ncbi:MAG: GH36-type glycosyl hydrolase domain-containing protein, partial [Candidatus Kryptonium sp.]